MSLIKILYKILNIKDKPLFYQYLAVMAVISGISFSLPIPNANVIVAASDGIITTGYLVIRQDQKK